MAYLASLTCMHPSLPLTGERTVPGLAEEAYWFARHEVVYEWVAARLAEHAGTVIDAGCGEGYGAARLAAAGHRVLALEYDPAVCVHAAAAYPGITVVRANLVSLPLQPGSVDAVVTLQVVEHLWDVRTFLRECHRVLRPGGVLIASTPNRPVFSTGLARGEQPVNPFHVEEFDAEQLLGLLREAGFADVLVHGLAHADRLRSWEAEHGSLVAAQVEAAMTGASSARLAAFVSGVTSADFDLQVSARDADGVDGSTHDLIAVAVRA